MGRNGRNAGLTEPVDYWAGKDIGEGKLIVTVPDAGGHVIGLAQLP